MDESLKAAIEKYSKELMDFAKNNNTMSITNPKVVIEKEALADTNQNNILTPSNRDFIYSGIAEPPYTSYEEFLKNNSKTGTLKIQAYTAGGALPVDNVKVKISKTINGVKEELYTLLTDTSGIIDNIVLPAPDRSLSLTPGNVKPFATYEIEATHPKFIAQKFLSVPIFDGIESIQPLQMVPSIKM